MRFQIGGTTVIIRVAFAATVTLMLLLDRSGVAALALFCCLLHEAGHLLCLLLFRETPRSVVFSFYGIKLERAPCMAQRGFGELAVYASGPLMNLAASLLLCLLGRRLDGLRLAALVSLLVGCFNLLPCRPLDGGHLLFCFLLRRMPEPRCDRLCRAAAISTLAPLAIGGVLLLRKTGNGTLLIAACYLIGVHLSDRVDRNWIKI